MVMPGGLRSLLWMPDALGLNLAAGERPIVVVPGVCWKALRLRDGELLWEFIGPDWKQ